MKIALVGATGTAGRATAHAAQQAGHEVIALSRATGIDLHTGEGLAEALNGAQVVIDTSNAFPADPAASLVDTFQTLPKPWRKPASMLGYSIWFTFPSAILTTPHLTILTTISPSERRRRF